MILIDNALKSAVDFIENVEGTKPPIYDFEVFSFYEDKQTTYCTIIVFYNNDYIFVAVAHIHGLEEKTMYVVRDADKNINFMEDLKNRHIETDKRKAFDRYKVPGSTKTTWF